MAEEKQLFIHIIDPKTGGKLVTAIEIVSPSNEVDGEAREQYVAQQQHVVDSDASLVEFDWVHSLRGVTVAWRHNVLGRTKPAYYVSIRKAWLKHKITVYPLHLAAPLPAIRLPLRKDDPELTINLAELFELTYRRGRFDALIDYQRPLEPPLSGRDLEFANQQIARLRAS